MGFVIRKATKTAKKLATNTQTLKESNDNFDDGGNNIPADLIVNCGSDRGANGSRQRLDHDNLRLQAGLRHWS